MKSARGGHNRFLDAGAAVLLLATADWRGRASGAEGRTRQALTALERAVGPKCRAALRRVVLDLDSEAITDPEKTMRDAQRICAAESR